MQGDDFQIGQQHADQTKDVLSEGMIKFYHGFWERMLAQKPEGVVESVLSGAVKYLIDPWLLKRLQAQIPKYGLDRIRGMASRTEIPLEELERILVLPDLLPMLGAVVSKIRPQSFIDVNPPPKFGCTSFISAGTQFLHGRNLDFPGVAYWDRFPVIQVTQPLRGLRYIGFTTAGVPICGITGINEAQISVSLHQHYCRQLALDGTLPFIIAERILSEATSLAAAEEILKSSKVATSWAFLVSDGKTRSAFVYETHPKAGGLRTLQAADNVLAQSNYFQSSECRPAEYATTSRMNWDNHYRKDRLESLVRQTGGNFGPSEGVKFMSDSFDSFWGEEKIVNRTVSITYNVQSLVLDPENMRLYMAEGDAPVQTGGYVEFDLGKLFAGESKGTGKTLTGYQFQDPNKEKAKKSFVLSLVRAFDGDPEKALQHAEEALGYDSSAEVAQVVAILNLKKGEYEKTLACLENACQQLETKVKAAGVPRFPPEYFELCIFRARTLDLLGRRAEAVIGYRDVAKHPDLEDVHLRSMAQKAKPYRRKQLSRILMPYSSYIPFE